MEDLKILAADYTGKDVAGMPDSPSAGAWTAEAIKARFDAVVKEVLAVKYNALIDLLVSTGAAEIGSEAIANVTGTTVRDQIADLKTQIDAAVIAGLVEGSVTDAYLSAGATDLLARFAAHEDDIINHVKAPVTTGGTASAYTATIADFDATKAQFFSVVANNTNAANATLSVNGGDAKQIVAKNANVKAGNMQSGVAYLLHWDLTKYVLLNPTVVDDHAHAIASVTGLQTSLDGKAASSHTHPISNVTNLQSSLDGKQATITGGASTITGSNLTANRVLVANGSGKVAVSGISSSDLRAIKFGASQPSMNVGDVWLKDLGKV